MDDDTAAGESVSESGGTKTSLWIGNCARVDHAGNLPFRQSVIQRAGGSGHRMVVVAYNCFQCKEQGKGLT